ISSPNSTPRSSLTNIPKLPVEKPKIPEKTKKNLRIHTRAKQISGSFMSNFLVSLAMSPKTQQQSATEYGSPIEKKSPKTQKNLYTVLFDFVSGDNAELTVKGMTTLVLSDTH